MPDLKLLFLSGLDSILALCLSALIKLIKGLLKSLVDGVR